MENKIDLRLGDCMEFFASTENEAFDLAIVDPPYGVFTKDATGFKGDKKEKLENDVMPGPDYFSALRRVSKAQIIWGGNYFGDHLGRCVAPIIWDKETGANYFADGEMAWTSFPSGTLRIFKFQWCGTFQGNMKEKEHRIHPTQKPVALYSWLLNKFAKPDFKILDTHAGSGSLAVACHRFGCRYVGTEIDPAYFLAASKRLKEEQAQMNFFDTALPLT